MTIDLPYPAGNTSRASYRASGSAASVPGVHPHQPSCTSGALAAMTGDPPLSARPSTTGPGPVPVAPLLPTRASGTAAASAQGLPPVSLTTGNGSSGSNGGSSSIGGNGSSGGGSGAAGATPTRPRAPADLPWTGKSR
eukprot:scaffold30296_cov21-Tisochrysis_lutea.AAC.2